MAETSRTPGLLRFILVAALTALFVHIVYVAMGRPPFGIDDADIFMVYARNLAHGDGFVYTPGFERVEGFSSLLWVLIAAVAHRAAAFPQPLLLLLLSALFTGAIFALASRVEAWGTPVGGRPRPCRPLTAVFLIWVFCTPAYVLWCTITLMDTGLWAALLITAFLVTEWHARSTTPSHWRRVLVAGVWAMLVLTRPEAPAWALGFAAIAAVIGWQRECRLRAMLCTPSPIIIGTVLALAALIAFRMHTFGYPFPNTYYAKVSPNRLYNLSNGFPYAGWFLVSGAGVMAGVLLALWQGARQTRRAPALGKAFDDHCFTLFASGAILIGMVIPILVGGDHFGGFRFYQPIWPFLIIPVLALVRRIGDAIPKARLPATAWRYAALLPVCAVLATSTDLKWGRFAMMNIKHEFEIPLDMRTKGHWLNTCFADMPLPTVGVVPAGGIQYVYRGRVIDLLGLNNVEMAHHPGSRQGFKNHAAFSKDIFLKQAPELVRPFLDASPPAASPYPYDHFGNLALQGIFQDPTAQERYSVVSFRRNDTGEVPYITCFARRDWIEQLAVKPNFELHRLAH